MTLEARLGKIPFTASSIRCMPTGENFCICSALQLPRSHAPAWECIPPLPLATNLQHPPCARIIPRTGIAPGEHLPARIDEHDHLCALFYKTPSAPEFAGYCVRQDTVSISSPSMICIAQHLDPVPHFAEQNGSYFPTRPTHKSLGSPGVKNARSRAGY